MKSEWLSNTAYGILGTCVFGLVGFLITHRARPEPPTPTPAPTLSKVSDWRTYALSGHRMGPADASVTIVEFADFECPFCRRMAAELQDIRKSYPKSVAIIFRQYPLKLIHPYAVRAAIAGECAAAQSRFEEFYNTVYARQDSLGVTPWVRFARLAGVADTEAFSHCLTDTEPLAHVRKDIIAGQQLGVSGTPTLLIDSVRIDGAASEEVLDSLVRADLEGRARQ